MLLVLVTGWIYMGKASRRIIGAALGLGLLVAVAVGLQGGYGTRIKSILNPDLDETRSSDARQELLIRSIELAEEHPLLGVGPGQFEEYSGNWHVAHNSYTEFAAEAGLLAAILFIWMLAHTLRKLRYIAVQFDADPDLRLYAGAMFASLTAYTLMIFFLSLEYQFLTYIFIGYASALGGIYAASLPDEPTTEKDTEGDLESLDAESEAFPEETEGNPYT
jgi:O-antigen ligase